MQCYIGYTNMEQAEKASYTLVNIYMSMKHPEKASYTLVDIYMSMKHAEKASIWYNITWIFMY